MEGRGAVERRILTRICVETSTSERPEEEFGAEGRAARLVADLPVSLAATLHPNWSTASDEVP